MVTRLDELAAGVEEAVLYQEELAPYLEALEQSNGTILLETLPDFPCAMLGLNLERRQDFCLLSYDLVKLAVLRQEGFLSGCLILDSARRFLLNLKRETTGQEMEAILFTRLLI